MHVSLDPRASYDTSTYRYLIPGTCTTVPSAPTTGTGVLYETLQVLYPWYKGIIPACTRSMTYQHTCVPCGLWCVVRNRNIGPTRGNIGFLDVRRELFDGCCSCRLQTVQLYQGVDQLIVRDDTTSMPLPVD